MFLPMDSPNQTKTPTSFGKADAAAFLLTGILFLLENRIMIFLIRSDSPELSWPRGILVVVWIFFLAGGDPGRFVIETAQRGAKESFQQVPN